jgi:RecJ-like exonuclease
MKMDLHDVLKTCPDCQGEGVRQNPIWQDFWKEYDEVCTTLNPSDSEQCMKIDAEVKRKVEEKYEIDDLDDEPEEIYCWTCDNEGKVLLQELAPLVKLINHFNLEP